jgi:hypothetical protein
MPLLMKAAMFIARKATVENLASLPDDLRNVVEGVKSDLKGDDAYYWNTLPSAWCCTEPHIRYRKECTVCNHDFGRDNLTECPMPHDVDEYSNESDAE